MAELRDKVETALNEGRMLLLGSQVLIGFFFRAFFEPAFKRLSKPAQTLEVVALGVMLIGLGLLVWPAAYHRIVEDGNVTDRFHRFVSGTLDLALLPFAASVGSFAYLATERVHATPGSAITAGVVFALLCLCCWYGIGIVERYRHKKGLRLNSFLHPARHEMENEPGSTELTDKIKEVLIECRMVLPGAQALLGFQFITFFLERFEALPASQKYLHTASLFSVAICTILLITPAAYHRIAEGGENSESFLRFASRMMLSAMVFLAFGIVGDFLLILLNVSISPALAIVISCLLATFLLGLWFGLTTYWRFTRQ